MARGEEFLGRTLGAWLDEVAAAGPAPGGGSAAAVVAAVAASLVGMTARLSIETWSDAGGIAVQADVLRERLAALAQQDAETYGPSLHRLEHPEEIPAERRDYELGAALAEAAATPLAAAAARSAARLVEVDLATVEGDPRVEEARAAARAGATRGTPDPGRPPGLTAGLKSKAMRFGFAQKGRLVGAARATAESRNACLPPSAIHRTEIADAFFPRG